MSSPSRSGVLLAPLSLSAAVTGAFVASFYSLLRGDTGLVLWMRETFANLLTNPYCNVILFVFVFFACFAVLQAAGMWLDGRTIDQLRPGSTDAPVAQPWWATIIVRATGHSHQEAALAPNAPKIEHAQEAADVLALPFQQAAERRERIAGDRFVPLEFAVWVLPLLGFIGTVIGITQAIHGLEPMFAGAQAVDDLSRQKGFGDVMSGLKTAFNTTLLGLTGVIPIMMALHALRIAHGRQNERWATWWRASFKPKSTVTTLATPDPGGDSGLTEPAL